MKQMLSWRQLAAQPRRMPIYCCDLVAANCEDCEAEELQVQVVETMEEGAWGGAS